MNGKAKPALLSVRVSAKEQHDLDVEAAARQISVSDLVRERLHLAGRVEAALADLRREVAAGLSAITAKRTGAPDTSANEALFIELVLLMRQIAGPQHSRAIAAELQRLGHRPWTPPESANAPR